MFWWLICIVAFLCILLFAPIRFHVHFEHGHTAEQVRVSFRYLYFIRIHKQWSVPALTVDSLVAMMTSKQEQTVDRIQSNIKKVARRKKQLQQLSVVFTQIDIFFPVLIKLTQKISIVECSWTTTIGASDAAVTGILCGLVWFFQTSVVGIATQFLSFRNPPYLYVIPDYYSPTLKTSTTWIGTVSIGKTMVAGAKLLWLLKMGGAHARTSDSIPNADSNGKSEGND